MNEQVWAWVKAPNFWHLATVNPDGSPHVSPMWVDVEGDHVMFNTAIGRVKEENMRRDPRVSLSCVDARDPYDRVVIRGRVVTVLVEPTHARHVVGAEPFRPGILPN